MTAHASPSPSDPGSAAIELDGVSKSFRTFRALKDVTLRVRRGERIVICGPSGSGKSTLIRCINQLEHHDAGRIAVLGTELTRHPARVLANRRHVGMVFQRFDLFPHLTVLQNCTIGPRWLKKIDRVSADAIAMRFLERVRVADQAAKYPAHLSGGQQQRAAIARALCMEPAIMLFDEPTSSLDPEMVKEVLDTIVGLADGGMTMVCVSHEMGFARQVADRIVFMDNGEIVEGGAPADFFERPAHQRLKLFLSQILR